MTDITLISLVAGAVGADAGHQLKLTHAVGLSLVCVATSFLLDIPTLLVGAVACAAVAGTTFVVVKTAGSGLTMQMMARYGRLIGTRNTETPTATPTVASVGAPDVAPTATPVGTSVPADSAELVMAAQVAVSRMPKGTPSETLALNALIDAFRGKNTTERDAALRQALMIANQSIRSAA